MEITTISRITVLASETIFIPIALPMIIEREVAIPKAVKIQ